MPGIRAGLDRGFAPLAWAAHNLGVALACAAAFVAVALAGAAGLRAAGEDPIDAGEYVFTLFLPAGRAR